jgi:hypothetical protein
MQDRNWLHSFHAIFADQMKDDRQRKPESGAEGDKIPKEACAC